MLTRSHGEWIQQPPWWITWREAQQRRGVTVVDESDKLRGLDRVDHVRFTVAELEAAKRFIGSSPDGPTSHLERGPTGKRFDEADI